MSGNRLTQQLFFLFGTLVIVFALGNQNRSFAAPQDDQAARLFESARLAQESEDYGFAVTSWNKLLANFKDSKLAPKAAYNAGICYLNLGDFEKSIPLLKQAAPKLDSESGLRAKAQLFLGFVQYRQGSKLNTDPNNKEKANQLLTTATNTLETLIQAETKGDAKDPKFSDLDQAFWFQGVAYEELGRDEDALKSYKKMLTFPEPTFEFLGHSALGDVTLRLGQYTEAVKHYGAARKFAETSNAKEDITGINLATGKALIRIADRSETAGNKTEAQTNFTEASKILALIPAADANSTAEAREIYDLSLIHI